MSRRWVIASNLAAALMAAAIVAGAFLLTDGAERENHPVNPAAILSESSNPLAPPTTPVTEDLAPPSFAELTRPSVDWASIYARVVPSLVSVVTAWGAGSGFFVSADGYVVTNLHVVAGASRIRIFTQAGDWLAAEFVAKDAGNDLALLQIDPTDVEIAVPIFGSADDLRVGDPVGALGAPFSLPNSLTVGIVSALDRLRPSGAATWEPMRGMIQTDAALNPGNSGGMLVDERGRVIGIPTQIESPDRASSGIGFAVSADTLLRALPTLMEGRDFERSYLGVQSRQSDAGLTITDVVCGSAADEAGIREGDRVLELNGEPAATFEQLSQMMSSIRPGDEITVTVQRGLRRLTLEATAGAWPSERPQLGCG